MPKAPTKRASLIDRIDLRMSVARTSDGLWIGVSSPNTSPLSTGSNKLSH
jgi:hypothetical protein